MTTGSDISSGSAESHEEVVHRNDILFLYSLGMVILSVLGAVATWDTFPGPSAFVQIKIVAIWTAASSMLWLSGFVVLKAVLSKR